MAHEIALLQKMHTQNNLRPTLPTLNMHPKLEDFQIILEDLHSGLVQCEESFELILIFLEETEPHVALLDHFAQVFNLMLDLAASTDWGHQFMFWFDGFWAERWIELASRLDSFPETTLKGQALGPIPTLDSSSPILDSPVSNDCPVLQPEVLDLDQTPDLSVILDSPVPNDHPVLQPEVLDPNQTPDCSSPILDSPVLLKSPMLQPTVLDLSSPTPSTPNSPVKALAFSQNPVPPPSVLDLSTVSTLSSLRDRTYSESDLYPEPSPARKPSFFGEPPRSQSFHDLSKCQGQGGSLLTSAHHRSIENGIAMGTFHKAPDWWQPVARTDPSPMTQACIENSPLDWKTKLIRKTRALKARLSDARKYYQLYWP